MQLLTYHGKDSVKQKYVDLALEHERLDSYRQHYTYWSCITELGCSLGCLMQCAERPSIMEQMTSESGPGLPVWLAEVIELFFENIPEQASKRWTAEVLEAIPVGKTLLDVMNQLKLDLVDELIATLLSTNHSDDATKLSEIRRDIEAIHQYSSNDWGKTDHSLSLEVFVESLNANDIENCVWSCCYTQYYANNCKHDLKEIYHKQSRHLLKLLENAT